MKEELARRADRLALMPLRRGRTVRLEELSRWEGTLVACKKKLDVPALRRYDVIEQAFREIDIAYHQRKTKILMRYGPYQGRPRAEAIGREAAELAEPGQLLKDLEEYIRVYQKKRTLELDELYLVGDYAKISILKQLARWAELLLYIRGEQWGPDQETDPFCLAAAEQARAREVAAACDVALDGQAGQYEKELEAAMTAAVEALGRLSQWSGQLGLSKTGHALEQDETFAASSRETREMLIRQLEVFAFRHAIDPVRCAKALVQAAEERGGEVFSVFEDRELMREIFGIRQREVDWIAAYPPVLLIASAILAILAGGLFGRGIAMKILLALLAFVPILVLLGTYGDHGLRYIVRARYLPALRRGPWRAILLMPAASCTRMGQMLLLHKALGLDYGYYGPARQPALEEELWGRYGVALRFYQAGGSATEVCRALGDAYDFAVFADDSVYFLPDTVEKLLCAASHPANLPRGGLGRAAGGYDAVVPIVTACPPKKGGSLLARIFSDPVGYSLRGSSYEDLEQQLFGETFFGGIGVVNVASGRQAAWEESLRTGSLVGCFAMSHKKSDIGKSVPSLRRMLGEFILGSGGSGYAAMCGRRWAGLLFPLFFMLLMAASYFQDTWGWLICNALAIFPVVLKPMLEFNRAINLFLMNYKRSAGARELWAMLRQTVVKSAFELFLMPYHCSVALTGRRAREVGYRSLWMGPLFGLAQWCLPWIGGRFVWYGTAMGLLFLATPGVMRLLARGRRRRPSPEEGERALLATLEADAGKMEDGPSVWDICSQLVLAMLEDRPDQAEGLVTWMAGAEKRGGLFFSFYGPDGARAAEDCQQEANGILACLLLALESFLEERGRPGGEAHGLAKAMELAPWGQEALYQTRLLPCRFAAMALGRGDYDAWRGMKRLMIRRKMVRGLLSEYGGADEYFFPLFFLYDDTLLDESQSTACRLQTKGGWPGSGGFLQGRRFIKNGKKKLSLLQGGTESAPTPYALLLMGEAAPGKLGLLKRWTMPEGQDAYSVLMGLLGYEAVFCGRIRACFWRNDCAAAYRALLMEMPSPDQIIIREYAEEEPSR